MTKCSCGKRAEHRWGVPRLCSDTHKRRRRVMWLCRECDKFLNQWVLTHLYGGVTPAVINMIKAYNADHPNR